MDWMNKKITKFSGGGIKKITQPEYITLENALNEIETEVYKNGIDVLRTMEKAEYKKEKSNLDYTVFSCECSKRDAKNVDNVNGMIGGDIDGLESLQHAEQIKDDFRSDKHIIAAWVSPSGKGIKFLCGYDQVKFNIDDAFHYLDKYMKDKYNISIDQSCKDLTRACFVSSDKEIHINEHAIPLPLEKTLSVDKSNTKLLKKQIAKASKYDFTEMEKCVSKIEINSINITDTYQDWVNVGFCLAYHFGDTGREFFHRISQVSNKYDGPENNAKYDHLVKTVSHNIPLQYIYNKSGFKEVKGKNAKRILTIGYLNDIRIRRNLITKKLETSKGINLDDEGINTLYININLKCIEIAKNDFLDILNSNYIPSYNPLIDYYDWSLRTVSGDEVKLLLDSLNYEGKESLITYLLIRWLLQIPATINGHVPELCLVFAGKQGNGKTELFKRMLPKELLEYFTIDKLDNGKDSDILMTEKLIILDDEFGGKSKKDASHLKGLLSKHKFSIRRPYGRTNEDIKRLAVLCGTCNTYDLIYDNTGNRRIIPIKLISRDFEVFDSIDKSKLWTTIFKMWDRDKESHKPTREELKYLDEISKDYEVTNLEGELISKHVLKADGPTGGKTKFMSASDVCIYLEQITKKRLSHIKVGQELSIRGFVSEKKRTSKNSNPTKGYYVELAEVDDDLRIGELVDFS